MQGRVNVIFVPIAHRQPKFRGCLGVSRSHFGFFQKAGFLRLGAGFVGGLESMLCFGMDASFV
ncbi:hypothetical protein HAL07_02740 [Helicobacter ailurogastricus]|uniref:Uncharacterized protein n=1 Tax=Helicobacter ailurogastricus TaxID=1578720 RepID=A0A0K2XZQ4_9HELI|nr:hypothetical protein HAL07_02740 [Helicobacter ailurogastricus]